MRDIGLLEFALRALALKPVRIRHCPVITYIAWLARHYHCRVSATITSLAGNYASLATARETLCHTLFNRSVSHPVIGEQSSEAPDR